MKKQARKEKILKEIEELKESLNEDQKDFFNDYMTKRVQVYDKETDKLQPVRKLTSIAYLDDVMSEYADSQVSVYYYDQVNYYREHVAECMLSFNEWGCELKDFNDLEDAVAKAGVCGWYDEVYDNLCEGYWLEDINNLIHELEGLEDEE